MPELADVWPALTTLTQIHAALPVEKKQRFFEHSVAQERLDISSSTFYRWRDDAIELGVIPDDSHSAGSAWENDEPT